MDLGQFALAADVVTKEGRDAIEIMQLLVIPVVVTAIPVIGNMMKKTKEAAQEAADSVRPNGSGHKSMTHMLEDVLMTLGEIKGDVKGTKEALRDHISSPGHLETLSIAKANSSAIEDLKDIINDFRRRSRTA